MFSVEVNFAAIWDKRDHIAILNISVLRPSQVILEAQSPIVDCSVITCDSIKEPTTGNQVTLVAADKCCHFLRCTNERTIRNTLNDLVVFGVAVVFNSRSISICGTGNFNPILSFKATQTCVRLDCTVELVEVTNCCVGWVVGALLPVRNTNTLSATSGYTDCATTNVAWDDLEYWIQDVIAEDLPAICNLTNKDTT
ncbi:hypothetical protein D3C86_1192040 [compost metagenome]